MSEAPPPGTPARRFGAPREANVPRMENVRVTAPDLKRRAAMEKTRGRLVFAAAGFAALFGAVTLKLADATIIQPVLPKPQAAARRPEPPPQPGSAAPDASGANPLGDAMPHAERAMITDRNGEIMAISLPTAGLFANPRQLTDAADAAHKLHSVLPRLDEAMVQARLADTTKQFVYLARQITPREELAINELGLPGIQFQATERRRYPLGRVASQVMGGVDVDNHGVAGVERAFEERLHENRPLRLSLDVRVQQVMRDELTHAMEEFHAIGACGVVMDVRTGEVIAMVSLPDYDANELGRATPDERFNRAVAGVYEPGSTFKLQTVSMALDDGVVNIWNGFDASAPIKIGRFTIRDFQGKGRWLSVPEIIAYSSNIGAAHMAEAVGAERQRAWMGKLGMMTKSGIELPEVARPLFPPLANWKEAATLTIGFGQGLAVAPIQVVAGTAAVATGFLPRPTLVAAAPDAPVAPGPRIMQAGTSDTVRKLMRLVVTDGYGKPADVPGYFVGGKTGTAQKTGGGRGYAENKRISAFMAAFPMNAPRYAVYFMLDEPKGTKETGGFATAGMVSAPSAGRVIARIGPMLGLLPETDNAAAVQAGLAIPLQPGRSGAAPKPRPAVPASPPMALLPRSTPVASPAPDAGKPEATRPGATKLRDIRHEAVWRTQGPAVADE